VATPWPQGVYHRISPHTASIYSWRLARGLVLDEHFLDFFADKGFHAVAVSLRKHGNSHTMKPRTCSVADYVNDVDSVAASLPTKPVIIGHSMGGFVVQKYLEKHSAPAGVLLASLPVSEASRGLLRIVARHPLRFALRSQMLSATPRCWTRSTTGGKRSISRSSPSPSHSK
jgi:alpha-beta hydrolase superfamily lysophospholipase